jgi:CheY-like chemotaxis protein
MILLDLNLPGMDGRDVLQRVKNDARLKSVPVLVLTTSSNDYDIQTCYNIGVNAYLRKASEFSDFVEMTRSMKDFWFGCAALPNE